MLQNVQINGAAGKKKIIETFILVCEASYGPISDCEYQLFCFSFGTTLSAAISAIFARICEN